MHFLLVRARATRARMLGAMRRLLIVVSVTVFADTMLFSAIVPLIPCLTDTYDLSKLDAGLLVGRLRRRGGARGDPLRAARVADRAEAHRHHRAARARALDTRVRLRLLGRRRSGLRASSRGSRARSRGRAPSPGSRSRRRASDAGRLLGTVFSFAVLGFIVGPAVGAIARAGFDSRRHSSRSRSLTVARRRASPLRSRPGARTCDIPMRFAEPCATAASSRAVWLTVVPALFLGVVDLLVPLSLDDADWGTVAIAATFIVAALVEVALAPADRRLQRPPRAPLHRSGRDSLLLVGRSGRASRCRPLRMLIACWSSAASIAASVIYTPSTALDLRSCRGERDTAGARLRLHEHRLGRGSHDRSCRGGALAGALGDPAPYILCAGSPSQRSSSSAARASWRDPLSVTSRTGARRPADVRSPQIM